MPRQKPHRKIGRALTPSGALVDVGTGPAAPTATYSATNVTVDRAFDADATTLDEVADVLGTLLADLRARGIVG